MRFKSPDLSSEFIKLGEENPDLRELCTLLELELKDKYGYEPMATHIFRTQAQHDALYAKTSPDKRPGRSPHMDWKAIDLRTHDMTDEQVMHVVDWCNREYKNPSGRKVAFAHKIAGNAYHLHIQYKV